MRVCDLEFFSTAVWSASVPGMDTSCHSYLYRLSGPGGGDTRAERLALLVGSCTTWLSTETNSLMGSEARVGTGRVEAGGSRRPGLSPQHSGTRRAAAGLLVGGAADLVLAALLRPHLAHPASGRAGRAGRGPGRSLHHSVVSATCHTHCKRGLKPTLGYGYDI